MTVSGWTPVSRAVLRVPTPSATWARTARARVGREAGVEQGGALPLGEAGLAGGAAEQSAAALGAVAHGDGEVAVAALAVVGAAVGQAAEGGEVVGGHGGASGGAKNVMVAAGWGPYNIDSTPPVILGHNDSKNLAKSRIAILVGSPIFRPNSCQSAKGH